VKRIALSIIAAASLLTGVAVNAQGIKWHPGHYVVLNGGDSLYTHFKNIDEIGNLWAIQGVQIRIWWKELEPWRGHYDFSKIDAYLQRLKAQPTPKRLVLRIMDRTFGSGGASSIVPSYLLTDPTFKGGVVRTRSGYAAKLWEQPVMDRLIELYKRIGWRYNWNTYFEGVHTEESTLSLDSPFPWGYSWEKLENQYKRLLRQTRNAMPNTNIFMNANWLGSTTIMQDFIQSLPDDQIAAGSSNIIPHIINHGQRVWTGEFGADYRGYLAISNSIEAGELGGGSGDYTPKQINDFAYDKLRANHLFWVRNTWSGDASQRWYTGILPFLKSWPKIRRACPVNYGICKP
jgi:hypothetical protein